MNEGKVAWHDYCPRCKTSTRTNFGFGKIRICDHCNEEYQQEQEMIKQTKGGYY